MVVSIRTHFDVVLIALAAGRAELIVVRRSPIFLVLRLSVLKTLAPAFAGATMKTEAI